MINELITVGKNWRDPHYLLRQKAIQQAAAEFCLSEASFSWALDEIFSFWNETTLSKLNHANPYKHISHAVQVLAGNTPAVMAQAMLQGAILNVPQIIKPPLSQSLFPHLLLESFHEVSSELGKLFHLENDLSVLYSEMSKADCVILYGSDETIDFLKKYCSSSSIVVTHGHAVSCAVIFKEAANKQSLQGLAWDMLSYDQRGCLSPRVTFIEQGGDLSPQECAEMLAQEILPEIALSLPRGGLFPGEAAAILQRKAVYGFRGHVFSGNDWIVCYDDELIWPEESLPRFMPIKSFSTDRELHDVLKPIQPFLISVGIAGDRDLLEWGSYPQLRHICPLGDMQKQLLL